ncbi:MAG: MFS transporter [Bifidobacteriaceae bacterium]|jgi:MFS family permease|nr:MFS transporter [Bifidobacteriaceae bacterium]
MSNATPPAHPAAAAGPPIEEAPHRRLLLSLPVVWIALLANYQGLQQVLLPNQVRDLDPENKITNLALVTTIGVMFTFVVQPIIGAFSDRTRSRLGRRTPWMLAGSMIAAVFLLGMGHLRSLFWVAAFWVVIQLALNVLQGPLSAIVADRFPRSKRGTASAAVGIGTIIGTTAGVVGAGALAERLGPGYTVFGVAILAVTGAFIAFNRDSSSLALEREPFNWRGFVRGFWVSPRRYPDFHLAFFGRLLFLFGYTIVSVYQLYTLTDYIGLTEAEANQKIGLLSVALLGGVLATVLLGGWLSDRLRRRKVFLYIASVLMGAGLVVPLFSPTLAGMCVLGILVGMGFGLYLSADQALMTEVLPKAGASAAKDLGILNIANNIPGAASPGLAAFLINAFGGYPALFVFGLVCVVAAAAVIVPIKSVR